MGVGGLGWGMRVEVGRFIELEHGKRRGVARPRVYPQIVDGGVAYALDGRRRLGARGGGCKAARHGLEGSTLRVPNYKSDFFFSSGGFNTWGSPSPPPALAGLLEISRSAVEIRPVTSGQPDRVPRPEMAATFSVRISKLSARDLPAMDSEFARPRSRPAALLEHAPDPPSSHISSPQRTAYRTPS